MAIDSTLTPYVPKSFYSDNGQLSVPGSGSTADAEATASAVATGIQAYVKDMPPAKAASFMAAVNAADPSTFAPNGKVPADLSIRLVVLDKALTLFRSMMVSGNDANLLARVMIEQYGQQRHEAVADRMMMRQIAQAELLAAAGEMDKQAGEMMQGALTSLIINCVGAALQVAMSGAALGGKLSSLKSEMKATTQMGEAESGLAALEKNSMKAPKGSPEEGVEAPGATKVKVGDIEAPAIKPEPSQTKPGMNADEGPAADLTKSQPKGSVSKTEKTAEEQQTEATAEQLIKQKYEAKTTLIDIEGSKAKWDMVGQNAVMAGRLGEAFANFFNTQAQAGVKTSEAEQKRDEAVSEQANSAADVKKAVVDALDDLIKQLIQFVKELQDAKAERMATFTKI